MNIYKERTKFYKEEGNFTTDVTEIKRSKKDYHEQLYANKSDNLGKKVGKYLEIYNWPGLNHEEMENWTHQ